MDITTGIATKGVLLPTVAGDASAREVALVLEADTGTLYVALVADSSCHGFINTADFTSGERARSRVWRE